MIQRVPLLRGRRAGPEHQKRGERRGQQAPHGRFLPPIGDPAPRPAILCGGAVLASRLARGQNGRYRPAERRGRSAVHRLLPTSLVGSYPQPDWLIDRERLAGRFPPRVRAAELWRVAPEWLEQAQDDATLLAIRDQERAGLDIVTDGEMRRESYSNRFATALDGVDLDNPGVALDRSGHPNPVPRVVGPIRRRHAVEARDMRFLRANTERAVKITVPGPFTMSQQAQNDFYADPAEMAMDYAAAVNAEIRDLFAAGADVVQVDEPYMQARPDAARQYGLAALERRWRASRARRRCTSASATPRSSTSGLPATPSCRSCAAAGCGRSRSRRRNRGWTPPSWKACAARP
jgi:5-methyltetrahydropteroyltriglutamate--homocysteine methyltransferase